MLFFLNKKRMHALNFSVQFNITQQKSINTEPTSFSQFSEMIFANFTIIFLTYLNDSSNIKTLSTILFSSFFF